MSDGHPCRPFFAKPGCRIPLVPKVSGALWERTRATKLRFGGWRERVEPRSRASSPEGDGVSPGRTFPKRCANFGNKTKLPDDQLLALAGSQSRVLFTHDTRFKALAES
jgi:hypothetical protein